MQYGHYTDSDFFNSLYATTYGVKNLLPAHSRSIYVPYDSHSRKQLFIFFNWSHPDAFSLNPLNPELNPICYLLALLGAHHFLHVSRIRVKLLTFRLLMSYIWSTHS